MKMTKSVKNHFTTAQLLLDGVKKYGSRTRQVGHNSSRTLQSVNDSPLRTGKTRNLAGTKGSGRRAV
ncbi:MAG: hypothetical protein ACLSEY_13905 [Enterocloster sp.]